MKALKRDYLTVSQTIAKRRLFSLEARQPPFGFPPSCADRGPAERSPRPKPERRVPARETASRQTTTCCRSGIASGTIAKPSCQWQAVGMVKRRFFLSLALALSTAVPAPALSVRPDLKSLPAAISKKCDTPVGWVAIEGNNEVHLSPSPNADFGKIECILREVQAHPNVSLGFVGNEADPNQVLPSAWSYIAGGSIDALTNLSIEVKKAGWEIGTFAKADDGTGFLLFHTPAGMTVGKARVFASRLWKHQLGDITFGKPPTKDGESFNGE